MGQVGATGDDGISAKAPFHSVVQTTWGGDGHSSHLELSLKGTLGIHVSDNLASDGVRQTYFPAGLQRFSSCGASM